MAIVLGRLPALPPAPHADENAALHRELLRLCEVCWMSEPNSRPRMRDVIMLDIFQASRGPLFDYDLAPPAVNSGSVDGTASGDCRVSIFGFEMPRTASPGPLDIQNFAAILGQFNPAETHGRRDLDVCNCASHGPGESEGGQMVSPEDNKLETLCGSPHMCTFRSQLLHPSTMEKLPAVSIVAVTDGR